MLGAKKALDHTRGLKAEFFNSYLKTLLIILTTLFLPNALWASVTSLKLDSLNHRLSQLTRAADSVRTLYDIYDLSPADAHRQILQTIFYTARRAGDEHSQLDAARRFSTSYLSSDSICNRIESMLLELPKSNERDETILFMKVQRTIMTATALSQEERLQKIAQLIAEDDAADAKDKDASKDSRADKLDHIRKLYTLVIFLSNEFNSSILPEYMDKLGKMMDEIELYALRNQFYTQAANTYTAIGNHEKAVEADRELLNVIENLEKRRVVEGRKYATYDRFRYACYRRMLGNYEALSPDEIRDIYSRLVNIAGRDNNLAYIFGKDDLLQSYYYMAVEEYEKAIPAIKKQLTQQNSMARRLSLLNMLRKAAWTINDQPTQIQALRDYNSMLEKYNEENAAQKYRELQIKYEVHQLRADNNTLELAKRNSEVKLARVIMWVSIGILVAGLVFLVIILVSYRRERSLSNKLSKSVRELELERDSLRKMRDELEEARTRAEASNRAKDEFLHSMSHEIRTPLNAILGFSQQIVRKIPEESRGKLTKYSELIDRNAQQLEKIIDDVLYLSSMDLNRLNIKNEPLRVSQLIDESVRMIEEYSAIAKDVELRVIPSPEDYELTTDRRSAEQVLTNLLSNAFKFTKDGYVEIRTESDRMSNCIRFIVSDTGCGVPPEMDKVVFKRFAKLNQFSSGIGLGLYISKKIATMLHGNLELDTSYPPEKGATGARFIFTLPIQPMC